MQTLLDYTVVDLETTGLNPQVDGITEIAAIRIRGGLVVEKFQRLVNPGCAIPKFIADKTHITDDMVKFAAPQEVVLQQFLDFIGDDLLVGYNINRFDLGFIASKVWRLLGRRFRADTFDVWELAKRKLRGSVTSLKLDALRQEFCICCEGSHRALKDCYDTQEIYERLIAMPDVIQECTSYRRFASYGTMMQDFRRMEDLCTRSTTLKAKVPTGFKPVMKPYIPVKYKDRWPFVRDHPFKTFASTNVSITGSSEKAPRDAVEQILPLLGSVVKGSTTRDCDFCIALSEEAVTKLSAARSLQLQGSPIRIITDDEFLEILENSLAEKYDPENEREAVAYIEDHIAASARREREHADMIKQQASAERERARVEARKAREKELENYNGPRRQRSSKALAMWREEFTQLWNDVLADDVIEMTELAMLKTWLNLHKCRRDDYLDMLRTIDEIADVGEVDYDAMQRLYIAAKGVLQSLTPADEPAPVVVDYENPEIASLAAEYGSLFHPQHPFLDATYTPSVQMPAFDLTMAIADLYGRGKIAAIRELWKYIGGRSRVDSILSAIIPDGVNASASMRNEVWAVNALTLRMSDGQGSMAALDVGSRMLATTFSVNEFLLGDEFLGLLPESGHYVTLDSCGGIPELLRSYPPSLRRVFELSGQGVVNDDGVRYLPYALDYESRCYGSSAKLNRIFAESLGILDVFVPGVSGVPRTLNRAALMDILRINGVAFSHGEKREVLIEKLMGLPGVFRTIIDRYAPEMKVVSGQYEQFLYLWSCRTRQLVPVAREILVKMSRLC